MNEVINRRWLLDARPRGAVSADHFRFVEEAVPDVGPGQVLVKNRYLSFEPAQRGWLNDLPSYIPPVGIGEVMRAVGVGEVIASRNDAFSEGDWLQGNLGWQDYAVLDGDDKFFPVTRLAGDYPPTYALHIYGLTGLTAYFGMVEIGQPRAGDTVVVSGAAGATGSVAGQIAKLKGCRVIGIAGGEQKCRWLEEELGFDATIDYKRGDVPAQLAQLCKNRVDIFYDNVGGQILDDVLLNLSVGARVVLCGGISSGYRPADLPPGPKNYMQLVIRRATMRGFLVLDYIARYPEGIADLQRWVEAGDIVVKEDIVDGLEHCPDVLNGLFTGKNFGKQLVKV